MSPLYTKSVDCILSDEICWYSETDNKRFLINVDEPGVKKSVSTT